MVTALKEFKVIPSEFGALLDVVFALPDNLPSEWKFYLFRRSKTDITQSEIDNYFANISNLSGFDYNGLFVFDFIEPKDLALTGENVIQDFKVLSQTTYYYKAVIRNENTGEYSETKNANAIPKQTIKVDIADGKDLVAKAIEKLFDSLENKDGRKVRLSKDIKIIKNFSIEPLNFTNYVMIERVNGSNYQRFMGQRYAAYQGAILKGDYDADVIRATFMTSDGSARRDLVTNIFRAYRQFLIQYLRKISEHTVMDVTITVEGDYFNPQFHGVNFLGVNMVFSLIIQNLTKIETDIINEHITDMVVK